MTTGLLFQSVTHQGIPPAVRQGARAQCADRYDLGGQARRLKKSREGVITSLAASSPSSVNGRDARALVGHAAPLSRRRNPLRHVRDHVVPRSTGDAAASVSQDAEPEPPTPSSPPPPL